MNRHAVKLTVYVFSIFRDKVTRSSREIGGGAMFTNYRAPGKDPSISELRIDSFNDLYYRAPWAPEIWPDYAAPIMRATGDGAEASARFRSTTSRRARST